MDATSAVSHLTNKNPRIRTYHVMDLATLLMARSGFPNRGNQPKRWEQDDRFGYLTNANGRPVDVA